MYSFCVLRRHARVQWKDSVMDYLHKQNKFKVKVDHHHKNKFKIKALYLSQKVEKGIS
jgi:hypothetical protein